MMNISLTSTFHDIQAEFPGMLEAASEKNGGTAGLKDYFYVSTYVAAKHGAVGLTMALDGGELVA